MAPYLEDFHTYTPNAGVFPTGWHEFGGLFPGQVINNMGGGKTSLDNGYQSGLAGDQMWFAAGGTGTGTSTFGSVVVGTVTSGIVDDGNGPVLALYFQTTQQFPLNAAGVAMTQFGSNVLTGIGQQICWIAAESDDSISAWMVNSFPSGGATRIGVSKTAIRRPDGFESYQTIWKFPTIATGSGPRLGVQCAVWRDGSLLFTSGTGTSNISLQSGTATVAPVANQVWFTFGADVGVHTLIDSVFCQTGLVTTTSSSTNPVFFVDSQSMIWPFSGTGGGTSGTIPPVFPMRFSQAATEVVKRHSDSSMRVTQAPVEVVKRHTDSSMRISQAVVEIVKRGAGGWQVYEA